MSSCGPRLVRDHRRRAQPVVATTPARRVAFIFRTWRLFHVRGLAGASSATSFRGAVATAVGWAVLLVSTSVEVCVARERARGLETRRSRELACRALCPAARRCSAACARALAAFWLPSVFCYLLCVRALVLQAAWPGVAVGCLVWFWRCFKRASRFLTRVARVKSGNYGSNPQSRVFSIVYSDDTDFFEPALPALASAGGEHGLVA